MPELPDIVVYIESLRARVSGRLLEKVRLASPFLLRSVDPPLREAEGKRVVRRRRMGGGIGRLGAASRASLTEWAERRRPEPGDRFPAKVTAFREGMGVHGRSGRSCPDCGTAGQRIVYAENECNYCPRCQREGRLLADPALSPPLKDDWLRSIDELEEGAMRRAEIK